MHFYGKQNGSASSDKYQGMPKLADFRVSPEQIHGSFAFHDTLNDTIWDTESGVMHLEIRVSLLRAAAAFRDFLDIQPLEIIDVIFTGSNAALNYTKFSDLDVHLITDYRTTTCPALIENLFSAKKTLWNRDHNINIKGLPVEMYVENVADPVTANGVYSLLHGKWIKKPTPRVPKWDDSSVLAKTSAIAEEIEAVLSADQPAIDHLIDRIRRMRRAGLSTGGEFSVENMTFKALRNMGFLDRLFKAKTESQDRFLSLEAHI